MISESAGLPAVGISSLHLSIDQCFLSPGWVLSPPPEADVQLPSRGSLWQELQEVMEGEPSSSSGSAFAGCVTMGRL